MKISRELAILILKYCFENPKFYFPFLVMCNEYTHGDNDLIDIEPNKRKDIKDNESYKTFELWENLQDLYQDTLILMSKWFIDKILNQNLEKEIKILVKQYKKLYRPKLTESTKILEYWENEFFGWKKEAFEEVLELIQKHN